MKKLAKVVLALLVSLLIILPPTKMVAEASDGYLRQPTDIALVGNSAYIFDSAESVIKYYDLNVGNQSNTITARTEAISSYIALASNTNEVFVLSGSETKIVSKITKEDDTLTLTQLTESAVPTSAICFAATESHMVFTNGTELMIYLYSESSITYSKSITLSSLSVIGTISDISLDGTNAYYSIGQKIYKTDIISASPSAEEWLTSSYEITKLCSNGTFFIYLQSNNKVNSKMLDGSTATFEFFVGENQGSSIAANSEVVLTSIPALHNVIGYSISTTQMFTSISNEIITPELCSSSNIKIAKLTAEAKLMELPYSADGITLQNEKVIVVLAENTDHYYCMYSSTIENKYGYIEKSKATLLSKAIKNEQVISIVRSKIYKYPSNVVDQTNITVATINEKTEITQVHSLESYKVGSTSYSEVLLEDGTVGYIENYKLTCPVTSSTQNVTCNGKVKKDATIYVDKNGETSLTTIAAGTRIRIDERFDRNNKYTKVSYNLSTGEEVSGYIETININPDALSTLQIIGIVLATANILLLVFFIALRKKITKT